MLLSPYSLCFDIYISIERERERDTRTHTYMLPVKIIITYDFFGFKPDVQGEKVIKGDFCLWSLWSGAEYSKLT